MDGFPCYEQDVIALEGVAWGIRPFVLLLRQAQCDVATEVQVKKSSVYCLVVSGVNPQAPLGLCVATEVVV